jgi:hypothetical protein
MLTLNDEQRGKIDELQKDVDAKLKELLTDAQEQALEELRTGGGGFGGAAQPGQLLSAFQLARLTLTDEQKPKYDELQKSVDAKLQETLREEQRTQLAQLAAGGGPRGGDRGGRGGPGGRGGRGGGFGGGPGGNSVFRVYRYAADSPALRGKDLTPGKSLEEVIRGGNAPNAGGPGN